jgi:hypothetical protein
MERTSTTEHLRRPSADPSFRASWFGRSADQLFTKLETMPPAAPASLGAARNAEVLAYLMSQNQLVAADEAGLIES